MIRDFKNVKVLLRFVYLLESGLTAIIARHVNMEYCISKQMLCAPSFCWTDLLVLHVSLKVRAPFFFFFLHVETLYTVQD